VKNIKLCNIHFLQSKNVCWNEHSLWFISYKRCFSLSLISTEFQNILCSLFANMMTSIWHAAKWDILRYWCKSNSVMTIKSTLSLLHSLSYKYWINNMTPYIASKYQYLYSQKFTSNNNISTIEQKLWHFFLSTV
jgi:hypothetical protein